MKYNVAVYAEWERLVLRYANAGKNAHDEQIFAAMVGHCITQLLTFNVPLGDG